MKRWILYFMWIALFTGCAATHTVLREHLQSRFPKDEGLQKAHAYQVKREYENAEREFAALLSLYPADYEILKKQADLYYCMRDWQRSVEAYEYLVTLKEEKENVLRYYFSRKEMVKDDSLELSLLGAQLKKVATSFLKAEGRREEGLSIAYELFFMADTETLAIKPFKEALVREFPHSETGYEVIVNDFYAGVYPIWTNDSARVAYCEGFLERYPETEWRFTVYQYLLSSLHRLGEYERLSQVGARLVSEQSENAFAQHAVAHFLVEEKREIDRAIGCARKAIELLPEQRKPKNLAQEQWELEHRALFGDARMTLARALSMNGFYDEAEGWILEAIDKTQFGVNDYKSNGAYHCVRGNILEQQKRYAEAARAYGSCLIEGDVSTTWSARAESCLVRLREKDQAEDVIAMVRDQVSYGGIVFEDVTEKIGLKDIKASRIAWGDYNRDGFDDLLLSGCRIFENINGTSFNEVTEQLGIENYAASGGIWGDWNNDGRLDFFSISSGKGEMADRLWKQTEEGTFIEVTEGAGAVTNDFSTEGAAWGDANGDGFLDLYLANYEDWAAHSYYADEFYLCEDGQRFEEISDEAGMVPPFNENRAGRGVNWGDFDNDGDMDIYVSNYRLQENFLWRNNGDGTFSNVATLLGVAGDEVEGWWGHTIGSSWADYDNDGDLDLLTANLAHPRYIEFSNMTKLYQNLGPPDWNFVDMRQSAGIKFEETHSDPAWADIDNDGDLDLYLTSIYEGRKSFLYENRGDGTFRDITFLAGVRVFNGWGCAFSDFDCDGDVDLFVASGSGVRCFENSGCGNNYLKVRVRGRESNSNGVGARIVVTQNGNVQIREVDAGKGTTSQNSFVQHFGFGGNDDPVRVEVRFANGVRVIHDAVSLNQLVEILE
jgi:tetratricopeptide (TPR) repeat protein